MDTVKTAFIQGFVEKCASRGWTPEQTSRGLAILQLNDMLKDPDYAAGFQKAAAGGGFLEGLSQAANRLNYQDPSVHALLGAGIGGLGGLVFGGKNRLRNALLGALVGGGLGYGAGNILHNRFMARPAKVGVPAGLDPKSVNPAPATPTLKGVQSAIDSTMSGMGLQSNKTLGKVSPSPMEEATQNANSLANMRRIAQDRTQDVGARLAAAQRFQERAVTPFQDPGLVQKATDLVSAAGQGAADSIRQTVQAPITAAQSVGNYLSDASRKADQNKIQQWRGRAGAIMNDPASISDPKRLQEAQEFLRSAQELEGKLGQ